MKRILNLLSILVLAVTVNTAMAEGTAKIVFEETSHDFGSIQESDGLATTTFSFKNEGDAPLILSNVRASCGCTTPKWTREPIAPGAKGSIEVTYNPKNRPGSFSKSVTVNSNAENNTVILKISGKVEPREKTLAEKYPRQIGSLRVLSNYLSFSKITKGDVATKEMELVNDTDKPVKIGFRSVPNHLTCKAEPEEIPAHSIGKLKVTFDSNKAGNYGYTSNRLYLTIDGSNDYKNSIGVSATIEEDFSKLTPEELANAPVVNFAETSFDFGDMNQGDKKEHSFMLTNDGKSDLYIRNIKTSCGCTAAAPSANVIKAGETAPVKVTFNSRGKRGRQSKSITVITNDPKNPTSTLRISSNVIVPVAE